MKLVCVGQVELKRWQIVKIFLDGEAFGGGGCILYSVHHYNER